MPESTWDALVRAHQQVDTGGTGHPPLHEPRAAILSCSDARVPPSVLFDQPAGSLFVVRLAGNTAVPSALASLDYAVAALGVDLVIVLGHTNCGAVTAAVQGACGGHLHPIVAPICSLAQANPGMDPDRISALNVAATVAALVNHDGPLGAAYRDGSIEIRGAIHDVRTGRLEPVSPTLQFPNRDSQTEHPPTPAPQEAS